MPRPSHQKHSLGLAQSSPFFLCLLSAGAPTFLVSPENRAGNKPVKGPWFLSGSVSGLSTPHPEYFDGDRRVLWYPGSRCPRIIPRGPRKEDHAPSNAPSRASPALPKAPASPVWSTEGCPQPREDVVPLEAQLSASEKSVPNDFSAANWSNSTQMNLEFVPMLSFSQNFHFYVLLCVLL